MAETENATKEKLDFSTLEERLAELNAMAFMRAERECRMAADPAPDITYSSAFRAKLAAEAMGVPQVEINTLPINEYASVVSRVLNFLLKPLAETVIQQEN